MIFDRVPRQFTSKKIVFSTVLGKPSIHMQKYKLDPCLIMNQRLKCKMKAKKFLDGNRTKASCHEIGNAFLTPKATGNK